ncbi:hypothetical protein NGTWS0302_19330 [Mycolicibacterium cyprinidarum]|uniref:HTH tetR-type domain-containing protein n=1 Tax=Mycolicibacterium cyprinidarum TaxID=2860311 RepID=A0ABQ4V2B5_9MYCO|nr:hypothetical protein NGTWS1702_00280 [Mycolicibacterium sp. NGTWSNA01]GJF10707.1 hypothetical protein NGTWS1803_17850 [Mycolicibacterium sp. NGTWS1803]GJF20149.1 hypothetical protein NGTWS0302_19330 [Mycolicibacterium sp. NGTWS0302]
MPESRRRPGPRGDVDVRTLLVDTAEELFGSTSVDAVSLRSIARAAEVAPGALTHHFSSKWALVVAVVRRRSDPLGAELLRRLRHLRDQEQTPSASDLVDAILPPVADVLNLDPKGGLHWLKTLNSLALRGSSIWATQLSGDKFGPDGGVADLFLAVAARALPELSDEQRRQRAVIAMFSMLAALAGADLPGYGSPLGADGVDPDFLLQLAAFTSAGLQS